MKCILRKFLVILTVRIYIYFLKNRNLINFTARQTLLNHVVKRKSAVFSFYRQRAIGSCHCLVNFFHISRTGSFVIDTDKAPDLERVAGTLTLVVSTLLSDRPIMPFRRIIITVGRPEEATHPDALKAALAEFFSTLIFVFAGQGSGLAFSHLTHGAPTTPAGLIAAAVAHGFALFVAVSVGANISGGHVNPAVTFGALVGGNITVLRGILYWIAQLLGAVIANLLLEFVIPDVKISAFALSSGLGVWNAFVLEIVMTFGLVYTVYATAIDPKKGDLGTIAPIAIGFIVAANILVGGPFSGAAMNPAVAFGPAVVAWSWSNHWIYWAGPLIGGGLAGVIYELFFIGHTHDHEPLSATDY